MKDKNEESFKEWYEKQGQNIKNAQHPIHLARRTWLHQQAKIDELNKYISGSDAIQGESLECKITGLKAGSMRALNSKRLVLLEKLNATGLVNEILKNEKLEKENKDLLKVLREAVNTIEAAELDVDEFFSFSEVYLSIKHLLEEDKK